MTTSLAPFTLRELDLFNDDDLRFLFDIELRRPAFHRWTTEERTFADFADDMREGSFGTMQAWAAFRAGERGENVADDAPVAALWAMLPTRRDGSEKEAWFTGHEVTPSAGAMDALVEHVMTVLPASRVELTWTVTSDYAERDSNPLLLTAARHGFTPTCTTVLNELTLPAAAVTIPVSSYRIETYTDGVPQEYRAAVCTLTAQAELAEDPTSQLVHEEPMSPQEYLEEVREDATFGCQRIETIALSSTNEVVGLARIDGHPDNPEVPLMYNFTYVDEAHRGHRLGLAMNQAMVQAAHRTWPQHTRVLAESDLALAHGQALFEQVGFAAVRSETMMRTTR